MTENSNTRRKADNANAGALKKASRLLHLLLFIGVLAVGAFGTYLLIASKKPPERVKHEPLPPLVKTENLKTRDIQMTIRGFGTVTPSVQIEIVPQVAGKVVRVNPQFKAGGFTKAAEVLVRIDPRDYELAVQQAQAAIAEAQVKLDLEHAEAQVARHEWQQLNPNTQPSSPLVLRQPQIQQAKAQLQSAQAKLAAAKLNLERTRIALPVDAVIMSEKVDLGQFVSVGQSIGAAYGIEMVEIEVPLEDQELAWFDVPGNPVFINGSRPTGKETVAIVKADFAGAEHTWTGYVRRSTGQVDKTSRLVNIVVEVSKPYGNSNSKPPLIPGTFVEVLIKGKTLKNAVAVPRHAVHNANQVWVVENERLYIRPLEIARTDEDYAYAVSGLDDTVDIVVSALDTVTNGMKVRTQARNETQSKQLISPHGNH